MGRETVPQSMQRCGFVDPSHMFGGCEGAVQLTRGQRVDLWFAGKQPPLRTCLKSGLTQQVKQPRRQHGLAIFTILTLIYMDQHPATVVVSKMRLWHDVYYFEMADF